MAKKQLSPMRITYYAFMGVMIAFACICFIMALATALSRPAYAGVNSNVEYEYFINKSQAEVEVPITAAVCSELGSVTAGAKALFDRGLSDREIQKTMISVAMDNMSNRTTWTAFHMAVGITAISSMRNWPNDEDYQWLRSTNPGLTEEAYYQMHAEALCKEIIGAKKRVLKVERRVKATTTKKQGRSA